MKKMRKNPINSIIITFLLSFIFFVIDQAAQSQVKSENKGFKPMLVKVEANYDQFQPNETLILTCWWQNVGDAASTEPLTGFFELSLGHQRIVETTSKYHLYYWDPSPATNQWKPGELYKTTINCKLNLGWGGSYKISLGLCDADHLPVNIIGEAGKTVKQVQFGEIEFAWGWGTPTLEKARKPLSKVFNNSLSDISKNKYLVGNDSYPDKNINDFRPVLLKIETRYDSLEQGGTWWMTCWWQNVGNGAASEQFQCFVENPSEQKVSGDLSQKSSRIYWEPYPATNFWKTGDIWKTTINLMSKNFDLLTLGLCDDSHLPIDIIGEHSVATKLVKINKSSGVIEKISKSWTLQFNAPKQLSNKETTNSRSSITIGSNPKINLDSQFPVIVGFGEIANYSPLHSLAPSALLREFATDKLILSSDKAISLNYSCLKKTENSAQYRGVMVKNSSTLAEYTLKFESRGRQLVITLEDVKEQKGFELLEIKIPSLLSIGGNDVSMVNFFGGGRLISLKDAMPVGYEFRYDTRNVAAILKANDKLVMESTCMDDKLIIAVHENDKIRTANLGMVLLNRARGKGKVVSIPVENEHKITIELLDKTWGDAGWQSIAKYLRKDLQSKNRDLYRRTLIYKCLATTGPQPPAEYLTPNAPNSVKQLTVTRKFTKIFDRVKKLYNILDSMPQILYIVGFQEGGFDNTNPYVFNTDRRAGTVEELRNCISEGKKYNAIVSMHDNYDDMYFTKYYDKRIVCWDDEGNPWKGWIWAGGLSYIISPYKYAQLGLMQERVKKTVELYGINKSYHLDVLSSEPLRYDFDPSFPASADKSLKGKFAIIDEFNKYGIDLTSETLIHPFVGHIGFGWNSRNDTKTHLFTGDKYIPLIDMVYHGTILYSGDGRSNKGMLTGLIRGTISNPSEDFLNDESVKWIYLQNIPLGLLYDKKIEEINENKDVTTVVYDDKTFVKVDFKNNLYEVVVDGRTIAKDWTTFIPGFKKGSYLAYSLKGGKLTYSAPQGWNEQSKLRAVTLTWDGEGQELPCQIINGELMLDIPTNVPVRIISIK